MDLFELAAKIKLDDSDYEKGLGRAEKQGKNFADTMDKTLKRIQTAAKWIAGGYLTKQVVSFTKSALDMRGKLEQSLGGVQAVFGNYWYFINDTAKKAYKELGLSQNAYLEQANKIGSLLQGSGYSEAESAEKTIQVMQRASDVASIMGIDVNDAVNAVTNAAKGNFTMMDNLGIAINATTIEAYALSKGIKKSYNTMTTAEKVGLAYELFLEKTAKYEGNYAKENETYAGSINTLKAAWENFMTGEGSADAVWESLVGAGKAIWRTLKELIPPLTKGFKELFQKAIKQVNFKNVGQKVKTGLAKYLQVDPENMNLVTVVEAAVRKLRTWLGNSKNWVKGKLAQIAGLTNEKGELPDDVDWGQIAKNIIEKIRTKFSENLTEAKVDFLKFLGIDEEDADWGTVASKVAEKVRNAFSNINTKVKTGFANLLGIDDEDVKWGDIASIIAGKIRNGLFNLGNIAKTNFAKLLGLDDAEVKWGDIASSLVSRIRGGLYSLGNISKTNFAKLLGIDDAEVKWSDIASTLVSKIRSGIWNLGNVSKTNFAKLLGLDDAEVKWGDIATTLVSKIRNGIWNLGTAAKTNFAKLLGIDDKEVKWSDIATTLVGKIRNGFYNLGKTSKTNFTKLLGIDDPEADWTTVKDTIIEKLRDAGTKFKNVLGSILGITKEGDAEATWGDIGQALAQGLVDRIHRSGGFIKELITGNAESSWTEVGDTVWGWITSAFEGKDIIGALFENISDKSVGLINFAGKLVGAITDWLSGGGATDVVNALLGILKVVAEKGIDFVNALLPVLTNIVQAVVDWLGKTENMRLITSLITNIMSALTENAAVIGGALVQIISQVLNDPNLWTTLKDSLELIAASILDLIFGGNNYQSKLDNLRRKSEVEAKREENAKNAYKGEDVFNAIKAVFGKGSNTDIENARAFMQALHMSDNAIEKYLDYFYVLENHKNRRTGQNASFAGGDDAKIDEMKATLAQAAPYLDEAIAKVSQADTSLAAAFEALATSASHASDELAKIHAGGVEGSNAKGAWDIPYDMTTRVHANEMILNATQARQYREGNAFGGVSEMIAALQGLRQDMQNIQLVVGEKALGRATVQYGGSRMNGYIGRSERRVAAGYGWG